MIMTDGYRSAKGVYTDLGIVSSGIRILFENPTGTYFKYHTNGVCERADILPFGSLIVGGISRPLLYDRKEDDFLVSVEGKLVHFDELGKYEKGGFKKRIQKAA